MRVELLLPLALLAGCVAPHAMHGAHRPGVGGAEIGAVAESPILDPSGKRIGQARFSEGPQGVLIRVDIQPGALSAGWHGAHLHETGTCADQATGFKLSGSHVGHGEQSTHGLLNPAGPEEGDLPNLYAPASGAIAAEFYTESVTLGARAMRGRMPLRDGDGAALIIHASPDDHVSQPIGGAGARVACAAITPQG